MTNDAGRDKIRVCLVDDHALIRQALRDKFAREPDIEVVGEAATAQSAVAIVESAQPDVAVLDVQLPDGDGVTICREIRSAGPGTPPVKWCIGHGLWQRGAGSGGCARDQ